jgi:nitrogen regulation protein NR(I)
MNDLPVGPAVLVVDDEPSVHHLFRAVLDGAPADLLLARTGEDAMRIADGRDVALVFIDLVLPDRSGLEVFRLLHERDPRVLVVLMTSGGTSDTAIEAIKNGAYDYLLKPLDLASVRSLVSRAWEIRRLMTVPVTLDGGADEPARGRDVLVGRSAAMHEVFKAVGRVAARDVTVLIRGESGTGKELIARAIYSHSHRADRPFLAINCAAIPETLLESELFGHEKGAFTGADRTKVGKFEQFSGGTLFLDEIGDMSAMLQSKILRVLQEQQFQRVGGNETIYTDVRLLAATNRNLERAVEAGSFREDLYYRLNGYTITTPALRERPDDIPALVNHFLARSRRELGKPVRTVAEDAMERLARYPWPGNVRELQNVVRRSLLQSTGQVLLADFLPAHVRAPDRAEVPAASRALEDVERMIEDRLRAGATDLYDEVQAAIDRHLILRVLQHTDGNQHEAAALLGLSRNTLRAKIRSLDIRIDRSVSSGA